MGMGMEEREKAELVVEEEKKRRRGRK